MLQRQCLSFQHSSNHNNLTWTGHSLGNTVGLRLGFLECLQQQTGVFSWCLATSYWAVNLQVLYSHCHTGSHTNCYTWHEVDSIGWQLLDMMFCDFYFHESAFGPNVWVPGLNICFSALSSLYIYVSLNCCLRCL